MFKDLFKRTPPPPTERELALEVVKQSCTGYLLEDVRWYISYHQELSPFVESFFNFKARFEAGVFDIQPIKGELATYSKRLLKALQTHKRPAINLIEFARALSKLSVDQPNLYQASVMMQRALYGAMGTLQDISGDPKYFRAVLEQTALISMSHKALILEEQPERQNRYYSVLAKHFDHQLALIESSLAEYLPEENLKVYGGATLEALASAQDYRREFDVELTMFEGLQPAGKI